MLFPSTPSYFFVRPDKAQLGLLFFRARVLPFQAGLFVCACVWHLTRSGFAIFAGKEGTQLAGPNVLQWLESSLVSSQREEGRKREE